MMFNSYQFCATTKLLAYYFTVKFVYIYYRIDNFLVIYFLTNTKR